MDLRIPDLPTKLPGLRHQNREASGSGRNGWSEMKKESTIKGRLQAKKGSINTKPERHKY